MIDKRRSGSHHFGRRIRLSTREIVISVVLTLAALAGIAVFSFGQVSDETAMNKPIASESRRPK